MSILELKEVSKHYQIGEITIKALNKLSFKIEYLEKIVEKYQKHWLFKYFKI